MSIWIGASPNATPREQALQTLCALNSRTGPLLGKPGGWAAGIVYDAVNRDRRACSVPGLLNSEVEALFGVSMGTIRKRTAQIERLLAV